MNELMLVLGLSGAFGTVDAKPTARAPASDEDLDVKKVFNLRQEGGMNEPGSVVRFYDKTTNSYCYVTVWTGPTAIACVRK